MEKPLNPTPQPAEERLEEVLDREFPKGKCKERGGALVLYAEAMQFLKEERAATLREVTEEVKDMEEEDNYSSAYADYTEKKAIENSKAILNYNHALNDVNKIIQNKLTSEL